MNRALQILTLIVLIGLLAGVLFALIDISQNGIRLEIAGSVHVTGMPEEVGLTMGEAVTLVLEDPANLSVSGPGGGASFLRIRRIFQSADPAAGPSRRPSLCLPVPSAANRCYLSAGTHGRGKSNGSARVVARR